MSGWEKVLQDLRDCSDRLEEIANNLTEDQLDWVPEDGGWSPRQIIHHLADSVCIWDMFIRQALAGQGGEFSMRWYLDTPQDEWAEIWNYAARDISPALDLYRASLEHMVSLLSGADNPEELALEISWKPGEKELVPVTEVVSFQPEHLGGHLEDINDILQEKSA
jgi:hypothetical protein